MTQDQKWKLVPVDLTEDMAIAFAEAWFSKVRAIDDPEMGDAYHAMLDAAPTPPASAEPQGEMVEDVCPRCNGTGEETQYSDNGPDAHERSIDCTHCQGRGGLLDAYNGLKQRLEMERKAYLRAAGERFFAAPSAAPSPASEQDAKDGEMLDWIESQINEHGAFNINDGTGKHLGLSLRNRPSSEMRTLRQTIEAAMTAAKGDGNG